MMLGGSTAEGNRGTALTAGASCVSFIEAKPPNPVDPYEPTAVAEVQHSFWEIRNPVTPTS
jgi:hypothetical protein